MEECENPPDAKQISRVKTNAIHRKIHTVPYSTPIFDIFKFNYIVPSGRINNERGMEGPPVRMHLKYIARVAQTASALFQLPREAGHPA
jgi:hypothetical protein